MSGSTLSGSVVIIQQAPQKIDLEVYKDIQMGGVVVMVLIVFVRFLYLITHPYKIRKIK